MELARLRQEHRDLDAAVQALSLTGSADALQLQRLKKKKLSIKDRISALEDQLFPDIIA
ncbi:YdcH family protein [Roseibium aestuarii]|uniref:YdcH family protein n=2 Tax=Roseibium aestuarii TaxID=2600299 RepID=A0ABW4K0E1_9HYPH